MEAPAAVPAALDHYARVAGPMHTIFVLALVGGWTVYGKVLADHLRAAPNPHRVRFYLLTLLVEWLVFAVVVVGVRRSDASLGAVLGERWRSFRQVLRDVGIAALFWMVSGVLLFLLAWLLRVGAIERRVNFMLPHGGVEIALWLALSVTAGICEETIFRGYLQRQFIALTRNVPAGILISAAAFGAAHAYQGFRMTMLIGLYGAMFGILAHWRGSVRPGMIAHAWQDSFSGVLGGLMRH
ncbi:MAG TPA: type II CAAX endopeptidase family protein [Terriglobales bacterium]|nr:type II CAAX endopeptidase family protein [Terriglobales bacterium]